MGFLSSIKANLTWEQRYSLSFVRMFFWDINWLKTLWLNFKALPFCKAVKLPIIVSYNVKIKSIGTILLPDNAHTGMLSIGVIKIGAFEDNDYKIILNNEGCIKVGGILKIHPGARIYVQKGATLTLGKRVGFGANNKIVCFKSITIGDDFRMSWNSQLFDTDFHFLRNITKDVYYQRNKPVVIGDNVFVGNGTTIGKGTVLPNGSVVSCMSKLSGDYSEFGDNLLISGVPGKVVKVGVEMSNGFRIDIEEQLSTMLEK